MLWTFLFIFSYFSFLKKIFLARNKVIKSGTFFLKRWESQYFLESYWAAMVKRTSFSVSSVQNCKRLTLPPTSWFVHQLVTYWIFFPWNDFPLWPIRDKSAGHGMQGSQAGVLEPSLFPVADPLECLGLQRNASHFSKQLHLLQASNFLINGLPKSKMPQVQIFSWQQDPPTLGTVSRGA